VLELRARVRGHEDPPCRIRLCESLKRVAGWRESEEEALGLPPVTSDREAVFREAVKTFSGKEYEGPPQSLVDPKYARVLYVHAAAPVTTTGREVHAGVLMEPRNTSHAHRAPHIIYGWASRSIETLSWSARPPGIEIPGYTNKVPSGLARRLVVREGSVTSVHSLEPADMENVVRYLRDDGMLADFVYRRERT
jgi:hypothetical protein